MKTKKLISLIKEQLSNMKKIEDKDIIEFVKKNSWFDYDGKDNNVLLFSTRNHGDVYNEEYGKEDALEGKRIKALLNKKFPKLKTSLDSADEWVHFSVEVEAEKRDERWFILLTPRYHDNTKIGYWSSYAMIGHDGSILKRKLEEILDFKFNWISIYNKVQNLKLNKKNFHGHGKNVYGEIKLENDCKLVIIDYLD